MAKLKDHFRSAILKLYGEDKEDVDARTQDMKRRVEHRRGQRMKAGVKSEQNGEMSAESYEKWMNLSDGN